MKGLQPQLPSRRGLMRSHQPRNTQKYGHNTGCWTCLTCCYTHKGWAGSHSHASDWGHQGRDHDWAQSSQTSPRAGGLMAMGPDNSATRLIYVWCRFLLAPICWASKNLRLVQIFAGSTNRRPQPFGARHTNYGCITIIFVMFSQLSKQTNQ